MTLKREAAAALVPGVKGSGDGVAPKAGVELLAPEKLNVGAGDGANVDAEPNIGLLGVAAADPKLKTGVAGAISDVG